MPNFAGVVDSSLDWQFMIELLTDAARVRPGFRAARRHRIAGLGRRDRRARHVLRRSPSSRPTLMRRLFDLCRAQNLFEARALQEDAAALRQIVKAGGVAALKAAARAMGRDCGDPRPPLLPLDCRGREKALRRKSRRCRRSPTSRAAGEFAAYDELAATFLIMPARMRAGIAAERAARMLFEVTHPLLLLQKMQHRPERARRFRGRARADASTTSGLASGQGQSPDFVEDLFQLGLRILEVIVIFEILIGIADDAATSTCCNSSGVNDAPCCSLAKIGWQSTCDRSDRHRHGIELLQLGGQLTVVFDRLRGGTLRRRCSMLPTFFQLFRRYRPRASLLAMVSHQFKWEML